MKYEHAGDGASEESSIERCRQLLGEEAEDLSDHEIALIRRHADAMAHVIVEAFLESRVTSE